MIDLRVAIVSEIMTNCYILTDRETGENAVVDPGAKSQRIIDFLNENGGLKYVILTHGHYDHIGFAKQLKEMFSAKLVGGEFTDKFLCDNRLNHSAYHPDYMKIEPFTCDIKLRDGDTFFLGKTEIKYLYTPGHTIDSGCYMFDDSIITGDTLFRDSYGRTDLPTGSDEQIFDSIRRLKSLKGDYNIYPGHGYASTLSYERKNNPIMRYV